MRFLRNKDAVSGAFLIIFSAWAFYATEAFASSSISSYGNPSTVPRIVIIAIFLLAIWILLDGIKQIREANGQEEKKDNRPWVERLPEILTLLLLAAYVIALRSVGYVISTTLYLFLQMFVLSCFEKRKIWLFLLIACIVSPLFYFLFRVCFNVFLPAGILNWNP